jgi:YD repeat-containing protein
VADADITINNLAEYDQNYPATGWMYLPDGTRYRISGGVVTQIVDRNGNKISFTHDASGRVLTITDSLNRVVTFAYNVNMGGLYGTGDLITFKGNGGSPRYLRVTRTTLGEALRSGFSINYNLFPQYPQSTYNPNPSGVPKTLWLPDDRKYEFRYNDYGEVARIELPTGGASEYDWAAGVVNGPASGAIGRWNECGSFGGGYSYEPGIYRRVIERRIYKDLNSSVYESRETISRPESINPALAGKINEGYQNSGAVEVNTYNYNGDMLASGNHTFDATNNAYNSITYSLVFYDAPWQEGKETLTEAFATSGSSRGSLLRREGYTLGNGHIDAITTTLSDSNQVTKKLSSMMAITTRPTCMNMITARGPRLPITYAERTPIT